MTMTRTILFGLLIWLALPALAAHQVEVLATHPPGERVVVGPAQKFHLRVGYSTDSMTRIFARPYFNGREVAALNSPSPTYRGDGETALWFTLSEADARVDEIRLYTGNRSGMTRRPAALVHRVDLTAGTSASTTGTAPDWVARLEAQVTAATGGPQEPLTDADGGDLRGFLLAVAALTLFAVLAPIRCVRRWRGAWRIAAAVPLLGMGLFIGALLLAVVFDPGSLGLWPLALGLAASLASLAIVLLWLARWLSGAARERS